MNPQRIRVSISLCSYRRISTNNISSIVSLRSANENKKPQLETRQCSVVLRPGIDAIGISIQSDKDVGHKIKHVEPDSPAQRAGIEGGDCIISLNNKPLLDLPYEDVLSFLKSSRNEKQLDFVLVKKCDLLKFYQNHPKTPEEPLNTNTSQHGDQQQGQIVHGIGPAIPEQSSWDMTGKRAQLGCIRLTRATWCDHRRERSNSRSPQVMGW